MAVVISCCHCCVTLSSPEVAEGEGVTWQWLVGVTMATGQVVAIKKGKRGGLVQLTM